MSKEPEKVLEEIKGQVEDIHDTLARKISNVPLSEIYELPLEKRNLAIQEMIEQLAKNPAYMKVGVEIAQAFTSISKTITEKAADPERQRIAEKLLEASDVALWPFRAVLCTAWFSDDAKAAMDIWETLRPYIAEEGDSNPEFYNDPSTPASVLMAAAAARARKDGKNVPPLKIEKPPKMPVLRPQTHYMPNTSLMNAMHDSGVINCKDGVYLPVFPAKGKQKEILTYTMINYDPGETDVKVTDPRITEDERNVSDAVISLYVEAAKLCVEPAFTVDSIFKAMPGGGDRASRQQQNEIEKAIEKFRNIKMLVDATEEFRKRKLIKEDETLTFDEPYFQMVRVKRTSKNSGKSVTAYKLVEKPIMLKYAEMTTQMITVHARHLSVRKVDKFGNITPEIIPMNADRRAITGYMIRRIAVMQRDMKSACNKLRNYNKDRMKRPGEKLPEKTLADFRVQRNVILFDTLFSATETATGNREQSRRNREFCFDVLTYWKATGYIHGYSVQTKGNKKTGIIIDL